MHKNTAEWIRCLVCIGKSLRVSEKSAAMDMNRLISFLMRHLFFRAKVFIKMIWRKKKRLCQRNWRANRFGRCG